jgi:pyruvate kinase
MGPAVSTPAAVDALLAAGMNVARLNFSHGEHSEHQRMYSLLRERAAAAGRSLAIMQDLQGPKIRLGDLPADGLAVQPGGSIAFVSSTERAQAPARAAYPIVPITYPHLTRDLAAGNRVAIDDGQIDLSVTKVQAPLVLCTVEHGGTLRSHKGVCFPGARMSASPLTDKDLRDLEVGLAWGVDYVALSFVRRASDIADVKKRIGAAGTPVIAKLELAEALDDLDGIVRAADGVMVARGDLGVEVGLTKVPLLQKAIIARSNAEGKIEIVATQMLESMTHAFRPTRAEVSDVANAILDGADAVMLSGETAVGEYPIETVSMMRDIVAEVEGSRSFTALPEPAFIASEASPTNALAKSAVDATHSLHLPAIALFTFSGHTARLVSAYRPHVPIVAFTSSPATHQRMALLWGVSPQLIELPPDPQHLVTFMTQRCRELGLVTTGAHMVCLGRLSMDPRAGSNFMQIQAVLAATENS